MERVEDGDVIQQDQVLVGRTAPHIEGRGEVGDRVHAGQNLHRPERVGFHQDRERLHLDAAYVLDGRARGLLEAGAGAAPLRLDLDPRQRDRLRFQRDVDFEPGPGRDFHTFLMRGVPDPGHREHVAAGRHVAECEEAEPVRVGDALPGGIGCRDEPDAGRADEEPVGGPYAAADRAVLGGRSSREREDEEDDDVSHAIGLVTRACLNSTGSGALVESPSHPHLPPMRVLRSTGSGPVLARLETIGRTRLASVPTPLFPAPALAGHLGTGARISIKADDCTGLGLGGNKVRKLEYELDPARLQGVTHLVTAGGPHSNHCRVTAAAAARLGLGCTLVVNGAPDDPGRGNAYLHRLLGARIVTVGDRDERDPAMEEAVRSIETSGGRALVVPLGASTARGALGYVHAVAETRNQIGSGTAPPWVFTSSSSGGTLAGLILGCAILDWRARLVGVSADEPAEWIRETAFDLATAAARLLEPGPGSSSGNPGADDTSEPDAGLACRVRRMADDVLVTDDFVGPGYGIATPEGNEATRLFGAGAGIILDPVYTAKAAAALVARLRDGTISAGDHAVFLHTGGHPALFR